MSIVDSIKSGLARIIWKGVKHAGTAVAGIATAVAIKKFGVELSIEQQGYIAVGVTGALGSLIKLVKDKFNLAWL